jgi:energy-coupling factor transporter ATP-binding protein EcfA2
MKNQPYFIEEGKNRYELGEIKNNTIHYDFGKVLNYLNAKGKLLFGEHFKLYPEDHNLLLKLCTYTVSDNEGCAKMGLDPKKGLLLSGPVGCGKTSLMKLIRHIVPHRKTYRIMPCRNVAFAFNNKGFEVIEKYQEPDPYCFDDLGVEPKGRYFGQDCNVMGEVILCRYDLFLRRQESQSLKTNSPSSHFNPCLTHITTNLNAEELEDRYGGRVRSRMRELFNVVGFDEKTGDKRK